MEKLTCKKCGTQTDTKFCPNCGSQVFSVLRSKEEIEYMKDLAAKVMDIKKTDKSVMLDMTIFIGMTTALDWVLGKTTHNPIEILVRDEDEKDQKLKAILEASKMKPAQRE